MLEIPRKIQCLLLTIKGSWESSEGMIDISHFSAEEKVSFFQQMKIPFGGFIYSR